MGGGETVVLSVIQWLSPRCQSQEFARYLGVQAWNPNKWPSVFCAGSCRTQVSPCTDGCSTRVQASGTTWPRHYMLWSCTFDPQHPPLTSSPSNRAPHHLLTRWHWRRTQASLQDTISVHGFLIWFPAGGSAAAAFWFASFAPPAWRTTAARFMDPRRHQLETCTHTCTSAAVAVVKSQAQLGHEPSLFVSLAPLRGTAWGLSENESYDEEFTHPLSYLQ